MSRPAFGVVLLCAMASLAPLIAGDLPAEWRYMLPPPSAETVSSLAEHGSRPASRLPVEARRPEPAFTIEMQPVGAFYLSCGLVLTPEQPLVPTIAASEPVTILTFQPVEAPRPGI